MTGTAFAILAMFWIVMGCGKANFGRRRLNRWRRQDWQALDLWYGEHWVGFCVYRSHYENRKCFKMSSNITGIVFDWLRLILLPHCIVTCFCTIMNVTIVTFTFCRHIPIPKKWGKENFPLPTGVLSCEEDPLPRALLQYELWFWLCCTGNIPQVKDCNKFKQLEYEFTF